METAMLDPSDDNRLHSTICSIAKKAIVLEKDYKGMLVQGDEVDLRIELWKDAVELNKIDSKSRS
jgi:hypothetical protein